MDLHADLVLAHMLRAFVLVGLLFACSPSYGLDHSPLVTVSGTTFIGTSQTLENVGLEFFGGIPFAEPPLGELRFAPPVPKLGFDGILVNATHFGPACVQANLAGVSEDCLTLNVFRPASANLISHAPLPVLVWIYGGGFAAGATQTFNASAIIAQSVLRNTPLIYVSINYRVGPFGFPQGNEADKRGALNLGLKDQLAGLEWVQAHIKSFGGDPEKVTIFGESAGAMSIADLYFNADLERLVRGAIFESGSAGSLPWFPASRREVVWNSLVENVPECAGTTPDNTFACLRTADTSTILTAWQETAASFPAELFVFVPVLDGPRGLVPDLPSKMFAEGRFAKIPFIAGTNLDEGTLFVPKTLATQDQLVEFVDSEQDPFLPNLPVSFKRDLGTLLQLYPDVPALGAPFGTGNNTFGLSSQYKRTAALATDVTFQAPRRAWTQAASQAGVKTFAYHFTDQNAVTVPSQGVQHGSEIAYVYGLTALTSPNPAVRLLSSAMLDYWISFAVSLTPNDGKGLHKTVWPQYQPDQQVFLQLDTLNIPANGSFVAFSVVPDTFHSKQISFITSISGDLNE